MTILVQKGELLRELGYRQPPEGKILEVIDVVLAGLESVLEARLVFKAVADEEGLPPFFRGAALNYVGSATLGQKLEIRVKALFDRGESVEGYILDTAGSVAITKAGDLLWSRIGQHAASRGFAKGLRRTPGCQGIGMETQHWVFEKLAGAEPGISLTDSCMMVPRKSLSFLVRFGGKLQRGFSCKGCPQYAQCTLRA